MLKNKKKRSLKKTNALLKRLQKTECPDTTHLGERFPIVMKQASGLRVRDVDNNLYTDFTAFFGVAALGHRPTVALKAIRKQMAQMIHGMGDVHPSESKIKLLELLAQITPFESAKTLLSLSGGDAIETAIKTAILATQRNQFLFFSGGYHGVQFGPLSLNDNTFFTQEFKSWTKGHGVVLPMPYHPGIFFCEQQRPNADFFRKQYGLFSDAEVLDQLESELKKRSYAALVMEPIQGRGGTRAFSHFFLKQCKELCKKYGTLLVFDEIFTGFGRTGDLFAFQAAQVQPDLLCVGKALGGGLPLSACIGDVMEVWKPSCGEAKHTQTFLGHPLACHVAYETILAIQKQLPGIKKTALLVENEFQHFAQQAVSKGLASALPFEVRGRGFMHGLWFYESQDTVLTVQLMQSLLEQGFLVLPEGKQADVLAINPPLIANHLHYRKFLRTLLTILQEKA